MEKPKNTAEQEAFYRNLNAFVLSELDKYDDMPPAAFMQILIVSAIEHAYVCGLDLDIFLALCRTMWVVNADHNAKKVARVQARLDAMS